MNKTDPQLGAQVCFPTPEGFMLCNYVVRKNGTVIQSKNGWLKFKLRNYHKGLKKKVKPTDKVGSTQKH